MEAFKVYLIIEYVFESFKVNESMFKRVQICKLQIMRPSKHFSFAI